MDVLHEQQPAEELLHLGGHLPAERPVLRGDEVANELAPLRLCLLVTRRQEVVELFGLLVLPAFRRLVLLDLPKRTRVLGHVCRPVDVAHHLVEHAALHPLLGEVGAVLEQLDVRVVEVAPIHDRAGDLPRLTGLALEPAVLHEVRDEAFEVVVDQLGVERFDPVDHVQPRVLRHTGVFQVLRDALQHRLQPVLGEDVVLLFRRLAAEDVADHVHELEPVARHV